MYERRTDPSNPRGVTHRVSATSLAAQRGESTGPELYKYSPYAPVIRASVFRYNRRRRAERQRRKPQRPRRTALPSD